MSHILTYQKDKAINPVTVPFEDQDAAIDAYNDLVKLDWTKWARITDDETGRLVRNYARH